MPMNSTTFSPKIYPETKGPTKTLSMSAGFAQLRSLADGSRVKAYIIDHEALALVLLGLFLIAGTVFYVDFQPRIHAAVAQPQGSALLKSPETQGRQTLKPELSAPVAMETALNPAPTVSNPLLADSNLPDQTAEVASQSQADSPVVHRKARHHHHRR